MCYSDSKLGIKYIEIQTTYNIMSKTYLDVMAALVTETLIATIIIRRAIRSAYGTAQRQPLQHEKAAPQPARRSRSKSRAITVLYKL